MSREFGEAKHHARRHRRRWWVIPALGLLTVTSACAPPIELPSATAGVSLAEYPPEQVVRAGTDPRCPGVSCLTLTVSGDVLLHPPLVEQAMTDGAAAGKDLDFAPMLAGGKPYVETSDLAFCHLETPVAPAAGPFVGYPEFDVPPQVLDGLVATGYDACSTASNHTLDQGTAGIVRTLDALDAAGLAHDGSYRTEADAETPTIVDSANGRVALISATYGFNSGEPEEPWMVSTLDPEAIIAKAEAAKRAGADVVVVAMHAGIESATEPDSDQTNAAEILLASPAIDLLYGHHAHVVQPLQKINGKWVIYGLGNMIAKHETPVDETREGLLVRVTFSQDADGAWTTSDIGWVPSLENLDPPYYWCSLTAGRTCTSSEADALALKRTTEAVNLYGADRDGAHPLDQG